MRDVARITFWCVKLLSSGMRWLLGFTLVTTLLFKGASFDYRIPEAQKASLCIQRGATDSVFILLAPELPGGCRQFIRNWSIPDKLSATSAIF